MGKRPTSDHSVDRIDVNGDYSPDNCRRATSYQQANNKDNNNIVFDRPIGQIADDMALYTGYSKNAVLSWYYGIKRSRDIFAMTYRQMITHIEQKKFRLGEGWVGGSEFREFHTNANLEFGKPLSQARKDLSKFTGMSAEGISRWRGDKGAKYNRSTFRQARQEMFQAIEGGDFSLDSGRIRNKDNYETANIRREKYDFGMPVKEAIALVSEYIGKSAKSMCYNNSEKFIEVFKDMSEGVSEQ